MTLRFVCSIRSVGKNKIRTHAVPNTDRNGMRRHGNICGQRWGVKKFGTDAIDRSMASQCIRIAHLLRTCAQLQPMPAIVICARGMAYAGRTGAPIINGRIGCVIELLFSGRTKAAQNPVAILKPSNHSPKKRLLPLAFEGYGQSRLVAVTPLPDRCGRRSRPLDVRQDRHQPAPARSNGGGDARERAAQLLPRACSTGVRATLMPDRQPG